MSLVPVGGLHSQLSGLAFPYTFSYSKDPLDFPAFSSFSCLTSAAAYYSYLCVNRSQLLSESEFIGAVFTFSIIDEALAYIEVRESKFITT